MRGAGIDGFNNVRSIYFPWHVLLAHFLNNLYSLFSRLLTFWFYFYRELCFSFYIDITFFKWCQHEMVKQSRLNERRYHKHSFVLTSNLWFHNRLSTPHLKNGGSMVWCSRISGWEAQTLIPVNELGRKSLPSVFSSPHWRHWSRIQPWDNV